MSNPTPTTPPTAHAPKTPIELSRRVSSLKASVTVAFTIRAKEMKASGLDVLGFAAGEPDFDTPEYIKDAAIAAMQAGETKYKPTLGDMITRDAIAKKLTEENGIPGLTGNHVAIGTGGKHVLFNALHALLDFPAPGDPPQEVLLPVPGWVSYRPISELAGGKVVEVETLPENDFKMSPEQLAAAINSNTRVLILNSPSNPCGTMYSEDELRALAAVVAAKAEAVCPQLVVLTDEIYEKIVYGEIKQFSIGSVPEIAERTFTLNGMSKGFAMTGWRIGYGAMPGEFGAKLIKGIGTLQGQMTTNITSFNYAAIRAALAGGDAEIKTMVAAFKQRAKLIKSRLDEIPGIQTPTPTGAFYVFPDVSALFGKTSSGVGGAGGKTISCALDLSEALLEEALVAFVPGEDFGGCGPNHVRISFACSEEQINKGMDRFAEFVGKMS